MNPRRRPKIRAPRKDGSYVVLPDRKLLEVLRSNRQKLTRLEGDSVSSLSSEKLNSLRLEARNSLVQSALRYTHRYGHREWNASTSFQDDSYLFLSGHQPEFFHPGVWFKNFLIDKLRRATGGLAVNLIVDNDLCECSISVPAGTLDEPRLEKVTFDQVSTELTQPLAYELATWQNDSLQVTFPKAVKDAVGSLGSHSMLLDPIWDLLVKSKPVGESSNPNGTTLPLGQCVAQARHQFELQNEVANLELPLSQVCRDAVFQSFLSDILGHADSFQKIYNDSLFRFRRENRVRSQSHPVPTLVDVNGWLEMPFWIWSIQSPWRGPLYVRLEESCIQLSDLDQIDVRLDGDNLIEGLRRLEDSGISIRPRALMTTMYCRVFLADLFVHGIGGAKYDELTDRLISQFYGLGVPDYLTATSTHLLPYGHVHFDETEIDRTKRRIRELTFHPERCFTNSLSQGDAQWAQEKSNLLANIPPRGSKKDWHSRLEQVNQKLTESHESEQAKLHENLIQLKKDRRRASILSSREYSFLLHPPELIDQLHQLSDRAIDKIV